uniref:Uncharacterized protein n=1 Tax=Arundo donax TaxID=35708 RepID=A0A0A9BR45_ARUDO
MLHSISDLVLLVGSLLVRSSE